MASFILADNQDLTRIGLQRLCEVVGGDSETVRATNKKELMAMLRQNEEAIVILDYTLFDFIDTTELIILHQRFPEAHWILISDELNGDFARRITLESYAFSIVTKGSEINEIDQAIRLALRKERFICHQVTEQILATLPNSQKHREENNLTSTEIEILKEIAIGKTTKEIAFDRHSSFHTVNTHRKNIFRKLNVNTAYEAIRYALRAGIVEGSDYNI